MARQGKAGLGTEDLIPPCILGVSGTSRWLRAAASPITLLHDGDLGCVALALSPTLSEVFSDSSLSPWTLVLHSLTELGCAEG